MLIKLIDIWCYLDLALWNKPSKFLFFRGLIKMLSKLQQEFLSLDTFNRIEKVCLFLFRVKLIDEIGEGDNGASIRDGSKEVWFFLLRVDLLKRCEILFFVVLEWEWEYQILSSHDLNIMSINLASESTSDF